LTAGRDLALLVAQSRTEPNALPFAAFHDLAGSSVFITGGGSGIGAALTEGFVAQGAQVAFVQRSDAAGLAAELGRKYGRTPLFLACDVTDVPALQGAMARAAEAHGPITVLVNNAANDQRHPVEGYTVEEWDAAQAVNLRHHFFAIQAAIPGMRAAGGGAIVNYSSISYKIGAEGYLAYVAAKSAITGLTYGMARTLGPDNIRVNAILPGAVLTERQLRLWVTPESAEAFLGRQCLKRNLAPEDLVEPTLFLASRASGMITGQALVVDGGVVHAG
jgi:NAD(P)-dependent dehydrogenase (short-subunit alcohol dehydrogenase family)